MGPLVGQPILKYALFHWEYSDRSTPARDTRPKIELRRIDDLLTLQFERLARRGVSDLAITGSETVQNSLLCADSEKLVPKPQNAARQVTKLSILPHIAQLGTANRVASF